MPDPTMADYLAPSEKGQDAPVLFRCHSLAEIMTDPKTKIEGALSKGAKSAVQRLVRTQLFGVRGRFESREMSKGLRCEQTSIDLVNEVLEFGFTKNTVRLNDEYLTGEADVVGPAFGLDIKTSWSIDSFPLTPDAGEDKTYEWQARGYMRLYNLPKWIIAYCLVDTPDDLIGYEDPALHKVSHIDPRMRVTFVEYLRDKDLEQKIADKCAAAQAYFQDLITSVLRSRRVTTVFVSKPAPTQPDAKSAFANP